MGYLKPNTAEMAQPIPIRVTSRSGAKPVAKEERPAEPRCGTKASLSGPDEHALVRIAERFAPGAQPDVDHDNHDGRSLARPEPPTRLVVAAPPGVRALIAVLIVVALLPSVILAAMLWCGTVSSSWFERPRAVPNKGPWPAVEANAAMTALDGNSSPHVAESPAAKLDAPAALDVQAGHELRFPIMLHRGAAMPARSVIAVGGLPRGVKLSAGRPYGDSEWNLRPDEIGGLRLVVGDAATGESTLRLRLIAPDGDVLAAADTTLDVTANSDAAVAAVLPAGLLYEPSLSGMGAWDEQTDGGIGIAERITDDAAATDIAAAAASPPLLDPAAEGDAAEDDTKWVEPSVFVNLRKRPSSSADVVGVIAKGTKLSLEGRKHGWMHVTDPKTSQRGWIYAGNVVGETVRRSRTRAADAGTEDNSETLWSGLGSWLSH
jgi:Bacterial SH3 domain